MQTTLLIQNDKSESIFFEKSRKQIPTFIVFVNADGIIKEDN